MVGGGGGGGRGGESRSEMVRSLKRQRDGDEEKEEVRGHCLFYSYRPLAPSVGSNPEQWRTAVFSQQPSHEAGGRRERQRSETRMKGGTENVKPYVLHVHAPLKPTKVLFLSLCPCLTWVQWTPRCCILRQCLIKDFAVSVHPGRLSNIFGSSNVRSWGKKRKRCRNWFLRQNKTSV